MRSTGKHSLTCALHLSLSFSPSLSCWQHEQHSSLMSPLKLPQKSTLIAVLPTWDLWISSTLHAHAHPASSRMSTLQTSIWAGLAFPQALIMLMPAQISTKFSFHDMEIATAK
ncbi:hypothetical protein O6H91_Y570100 [Diphasiastrum complanatum]|nr:hypothetical protein O6H91_Y570100 [Diphasiastrum complanatum]